MDYKIKYDDFKVSAIPTEETFDRLDSLVNGFTKQIVMREEKLIIYNLPDEALLRLKETVLEACKDRGL